MATRFINFLTQSKLGKAGRDYFKQRFNSPAKLSGDKTSPLEGYRDFTWETPYEEGKYQPGYETPSNWKDKMGDEPLNIKEFQRMYNTSSGLGEKGINADNDFGEITNDAWATLMPDGSGRTYGDLYTEQKRNKSIQDSLNLAESTRNKLAQQEALNLAERTAADMKAMTQEDGSIVFPLRGSRTSTPDAEARWEAKRKNDAIRAEAERLGVSYEYLKNKQEEIDRAERRAAAEDKVANISDALKGVVGVGQMIKGAGINPTDPKYPEFPLRNKMYDKSLSLASELAEIGNPAQRQMFIEDLARNRRLRDARSRALSGGNVGAYMTLANAGDIGDRAEISKYNAALEKMRRDDIDRFSKLASTDRYYDLQKYFADVKRFGEYDYPEFKASRDYAGALTSEGLTNAFGWLDSLAGRRAAKEEKD